MITCDDCDKDCEDTDIIELEFRIKGYSGERLITVYSTFICKDCYNNERFFASYLEGIHTKLKDSYSKVKENKHVK